MLKESARVLRPGGSLIIGGPNAISSLKLAKLVLGQHPYMPFEPWLSGNYYGHYREYTPKEYQKLIEIAGLRLRRTLVPPEPSRTMTRSRYRHGRVGVPFKERVALYCLYYLDLALRRLRPSVYCVGTKQLLSAQA